MLTRIEERTSFSCERLNVREMGIIHYSKACVANGVFMGIREPKDLKCVYRERNNVEIEDLPSLALLVSALRSQRYISVMSGTTSLTHVSYQELVTRIVAKVLKKARLYDMSPYELS